MASQPSGSKQKKGLRSFLKETLHVRSRSKSPSQSPGQQAQQLGVDSGPPSGTAGASQTPNIEQSNDGGSSGRAGRAGTTRAHTPRPRSPPNAAWAELGVSLQSLNNVAEYSKLVLAIETLMSCLDRLERAAKSWSDYEDRAKSLTVTCHSLEYLIRELGSAPPTNATLAVILSLERHVANLKEDLVDEVKRDTPPGDRNPKDPAASYGMIQKSLRQLEANLGASLSSTANGDMASAIFERMNPARHFATADIRGTCSEGTRIGVLAQLDEWLQDQTAAPIFWLSGTEGTGKTTIARTFCERVDDQKILAASLFCTRITAESIDPAQIVRTIAYQLAEYSAPFQRALHETLTRSPEIDWKDSLELFEQLIQRPLAETKDVMPAGMVVIIDGLDESGSQEGDKLRLGILERYTEEVPMKFLVTSRRKPEAIARIDGHRQHIKTLHLDDVARDLVRTDIERYLQTELVDLKLTALKMEQLVDRTDMLFICATVLARFILLDSPRSNPQQRLELVLSMTVESTKKHTYIDALYTAILRSVLEEEVADEDQKIHMRIVLWTVLFAQESIGVDTIATLAGIDSLQDVKSALRPLRPVIHHSEESGLVVPLHASFPEFMLNSERSGAFFYDIAEHSRLISERCFGVMEAGLRLNICGLESSFIPDREVQDLADRIKARISPTLAYACRHWANHLELAAICDRLRSALEGFLSNRLLFWMEVLNLRKEIGAGVTALTKASQWLKVTDSVPSELTLFVQDARDFVTSYAAHPISTCTPHIYLSALPFCPRSSQVYKTYSKRTTGLLQLNGEVIEHRRTAALAVWDPGQMVISIAYSPDGSLLAFGSWNGPVGACNATDGSPVAGPPKCEVEGDTCVAFSPDGSKLAVGSQNGVIEVWNIATWELVTGPFRGHTRTITSITFSPDGTLIATGSTDRTVRVWNVTDGTLVIGPLEGHLDWRNPVAFSPDGVHVASASSTRAVRVWDIRKDTPTHRDFIGHTLSITSLAYTPDGTRLVSGSADSTARVWSTSDGASEAAFSICHPNSVRSVAILPNGRHFVSSTEDNDIYVWDIEDGKPIAGPFLGHKHTIEAMVISPDGTRIASGSYDRTIRIWAIYEGVFSPPTRNQGTFSITSSVISPTDSRIYSTSSSGASTWDADQGTLAAIVTLGKLQSTHSLPVSPDGASIAVFLDDYSVEVVSAEDGKLVAGPFRGHTSRIMSVAFSSDGVYLATGSWDGTVRVWSVDGRGVAAGPFVGHTAAVTVVALSPNGSRVASYSSDRTIRVWNVHDSIIEADIPYERHHPKEHTRLLEGWTIRDDGWVVNDRSWLLFWVPLDFPVLLSPYSGLGITRHYGSLVMPKQKVVLGGEWDRCYVSE